MAELVRKELEEQSITQAEFARQVGVTQKHLSAVLSGKAIARVATLDYWLFALGKRFEVSVVPVGLV